MVTHSLWSPAGWVVGSLEILGSPASLVRSIGNGIADFFRLPYEGLTRGPGAFVSGVSRGTTSFVKHISKGSYFGSCNNALFSFLPLFFISKKHVKVVSALSLPLALCDFLARSEMLDL